jgi:putative nucleotidyltransferase with HDIG domain
MTRVSAILLGADGALLARVGRSLRERDHPTFVARDVDDAVKLARRHPSARVLALVGEDVQSDAVVEGLVARRRRLDVVRLRDDDPPAAVVAALDAAVARASVMREQRRLAILLRRRTRQLDAQRAAAENVASARTRRLAEANLRLHDQVQGLARLLALVGECSDARMTGHAERVARTSLAMGRRMGMSARELDDLRMTALLHDIGRMGAGSGDEMDDGHAERGARLLAALPLSPGVIQAVKHHHESYDGSGQPAALCGDAIPLMARIIAVADTHGRLVQGEPGAQPLTEEEALEFLRLSAGRAHDPELVECLAACLELDCETTRAPVLAGMAP